MYVNRRETGSENTEKPFYSRQKAQTKEKYSLVWVKLQRYIWRSQGWEKRPRYKLIKSQESCLGRMQAVARQNPAGLSRRRQSQLQDELVEAVKNL